MQQQSLRENVSDFLMSEVFVFFKERSYKKYVLFHVSLNQRQYITRIDLHAYTKENINVATSFSAGPLIRPNSFFFLDRNKSLIKDLIASFAPCGSHD